METRRSARLQGTRRVQADAAATASQEQHASSSSNGTKPVAKRARLSVAAVASQPRPKRLKGKLAKLPEMPLDILFEIFSNLHPLDLLRLARTTKALRGVLMNRSSRHVWKSAIESIPDFPPCPNEMSEPKYVRLAFDPHCSYCLSPNCYAIEWACRVRICKSCFEGQDYFRHYFSAARDPVLPRAIADNLHSLTAFAIRFPNSRSEYVERENERRFYRVIHIKTLCKAYRAVERDPEAAAAFLAERKAAVEEITRHADLCVQWAKAADRQNRAKQVDVRRQRTAAILDNLRQLGFGRECDEYEEYPTTYRAAWLAFRKSKIVRPAKLLTPRVWSNIQESAVALMQEIRRERLQDLQHEMESTRYALVAELRADYVRAQPAGTLVPPLGDLCQMPAFRAVAETPPDAAERDGVSARSFDAAFAQLPALTRAWRDAACATLAALLPPAPGRATAPKGKAGLSRLALATSLFACEPGTRCRAHHAHELLWHPCMNPTPQEVSGLERERRRFMRIGALPWNVDGRRAAFCGPAAAVAGVLVALCGLDARRATAAQMDALDARFACACCDADDGRAVMNWRQAVEHGRECVRRRMTLEQVGFERLDADDAARARRLEAAARFSYHADGVPYLCAHCRDGVAHTRYDFKEHMREIHDGKTVQPEDYTVRPDWPLPPTEPVRMAC